MNSFLVDSFRFCCFEVFRWFFFLFFFSFLRFLHYFREFEKSGDGGARLLRPGGHSAGGPSPFHCGFTEFFFLSLSLFFFFFFFFFFFRFGFLPVSITGRSSRLSSSSFSLSRLSSLAIYKKLRPIGGRK